ncbi:unnamed protein product, partial [Iphiclides podalirius]
MECKGSQPTGVQGVPTNIFRDPSQPRLPAVHSADQRKRLWQPANTHWTSAAGYGPYPPHDSGQSSTAPSARGLRLQGWR